MDDDNEADRGVVDDDDDDPWEDGDGIAIKTATLIVVGGGFELSSVIEIFAEIGWELSADDETGTIEELWFKNILALVSKEGGVLVESSAVRLFSSSSPLGPGMETGGERLLRLGVDPQQGTEDKGSA